jgi:serine/threonine-protein kinase HipA
MTINRCLYCYQPLLQEQTDFHPGCSRKIFGTSVAPILPYTEADLDKMSEIIFSRATVTGVQPKLSLDISDFDGGKSIKRFTVVNLWGDYIFKLPAIHYPNSPEVEDLTMHLATIARINTVPHCLIRMKSGKLAYITKRIDRVNKAKLHMEDMCQLTERLTEDKYHGSYEQIAKAIMKYSVNPGLDIVNFFEQVLFSFLTGNADMHLKNFSLINLPGRGYQLAPAYDMLSTVLVNPSDDEEMALTLNGKKRKIKQADFIAVFNTLKLDAKQQKNIFKKMEKSISKWISFIDDSFLDEKMKTAFKELIQERQQRLIQT